VSTPIPRSPGGLGEQQARDRGHNVVTGTFLRVGVAICSVYEGFVKAVATPTEAAARDRRGRPGCRSSSARPRSRSRWALPDVGLNPSPPDDVEALQEAVEAALGRAVHMLNK
jgi:hypothetical protein